MAIEAHHPSNLLFSNCGEETTGAPGFFESPSAVIFQEEGGAVGNLNPRKRGREESILNPIAMGVAPVMTNGNVSDFSFLQPNCIASPMFVGVNWPLAKSAGPLTAAGLQLGLGAQQQQFQTPSSFSAGISDELVLHLQQFQKDVDGYVREQGEILRQSITGKWQSHARTLIRAAVSSAQRRLTAKEAERQLAVRRVAELEQRIIQLQDETLSWRTKALVAQSQVSSLQIHLQQAMEVAAVAQERQGESCDPALADDAASAACVDSASPRSASYGSCRACCKKESTATSVVLPCRHLCLCADCSASDSALRCPVCGFVGTGILHIAFT
ncbi:BOI-related E3 ubiquitin-protein ligase 1-like [Zingiber officinale]|uniref:RING-type domain-containing protein n=1 Tax=Zingiber officinale TaxID=94328 RepID=A0A8J5L2D9_ZINOF|nr:BOI-related E3 ubiquitin-protein ligase 1-like [Zingiber officinale]KAG6498836.1 hypothetical protein ZIOFF_038586 [Zingiber officinale]